MLRSFIRLVLCAICLCAIWLTGSSIAVANNIRQINYTPLKATQSGKIINILTPSTVQLEDGNLVELSGIEIPDNDTQNDTSNIGPYAQMTSAVLKDMLLGQTVTLHQSPVPARRINRMGIQLAQIERSQDKTWVQGTLLTLGLARTRTTQATPELADQMNALEDEARIKKQGLWQDQAYALRSPYDVKDVIGSFQIVQGLVQSTANNNGTIYLNFGKNWREDFTVSIAPEDVRAFNRAGLDPLSWRGQILQVRGWVDSYNGPVIKVNHPEAIRVISGLDAPLIEELKKQYKSSAAPH